MRDIEFNFNQFCTSVSLLDLEEPMWKYIMLRWVGWKPVLAYCRIIYFNCMRCHISSASNFASRRPRFKLGSGHVGFCDGQKWCWGRFSPRTSVSPANLHSMYFSTIIFTITRGWQNRPGVAAVPIASQTTKNTKTSHLGLQGLHM
jgi:hypothetical protein